MLFIYAFFWSIHLTNYCLPVSCYADTEGQNLILTAKQSLINTANDIPSEISQMRAGAVVHVKFLIYYS
jgi:hypothetical protein